MDPKLLYHGSISGLNLPIKHNYSKKLCDFGTGFYLGDNQQQAENRICSYPDGKIYEIELDLTKLKVYTFTDDSLWALYIGSNRGRINISDYPKLKSLTDRFNSEYDVIIGMIADDKIAASFNDFANGNITDKALTECLKAVTYGKQYVIKTENGCQKLKIINEYPLSEESRKGALKWGQSLKSELDQRLDEIKKSYRRSGLYIDEVLEKYK